MSVRRLAQVHTPPGLLSGQLPRSLQVEQILRQRLQRDYQPGSRFSSEPELCQEFGVSRTLIRGVLARLAREGLVQRKAKRGTFVRAGGSRTHSPQLSDLIEHLLSFRRNTRVKVLEVRNTLGEPALRARLRLHPAEPLVVIRRVVHLDGAPLAYMVSFLPQAVGRRLTGEALDRQPIASLLPRRLGVAIRRAVQTVEPVAADLEVARRLGVPIGAPVLLVERDFLGRGDTPVYHSCAFYRGDRYKFSVTLRYGRHAPRKRLRRKDRP